MTPSEAPPASRSRSVEDLAQRVRDARNVLAVFGLALYVLLRVAYGRFYGPFGLSPDDLGLGYLDLIAQSAIGAVMLVSAYSLGIGLLVAWYVEIVFGPTLPTTARRLERRLRRRPAGRTDPEPPGPPHAPLTKVLAVALGKLVVAALALAVGMLVLAGFIDTGHPVLASDLIALFVVYASWRVGRGTRRIRKGLASGTELMVLGAPVAHWWRRVVTTTAILPAILVGATLVAAANNNARAVRDGRPAHFKVLGVPLSSWGAEAATVSWTTDKIDRTLRPLADTCLMYLGQAGGTLFLYSPHAPGPATYRVPAAVAAVQIVPDARCRRGARVPTR